MDTSLSAISCGSELLISYKPIPLNKTDNNSEQWTVKRRYVCELELDYNLRFLQEN